MANRFGDEYRLPHGGDSVFPKYSQSSRVDQQPAVKTPFGEQPLRVAPQPTFFPDTRPMKSPFTEKNDAVWDWRSPDDNEPPKSGGAKVPANPKKPGPKPRGGSAMKTPEKV